jgi:hypothetical protein
MSEHDDLTDAIRSLPRVRASKGFDQRVLVEMKRRRGVFGLGLQVEQLALAATVLLSISAGWWAADRGQHFDQAVDEVMQVEQATLELVALRAELAALRSSVQDLRRPMRQAVITLPGDARRDVVMDFRPAAHRPRSASMGEMIRPARFERFVGVP